MNKSTFIAQLRAIAKELAPLTRLTPRGAMTWNGTEYAASETAVTPDPYALAWQTTLMAVAELLEGQESPITAKQINYLQGLLFGGMGSLNDLFFDPKSNGEAASAVNASLGKQRQLLFKIFDDR
jgi:hypothetical protein